MNNLGGFLLGVSMTLIFVAIVAVCIRRDPSRDADTERLDFLSETELSTVCIKGQWGVLNHGILGPTHVDLRTALDLARGTTS